MGPGAGVHGGEVVAEGALDDIIGNEASITGDYLAGRREVPVPIRRRKGSGKFLSVKGARANNLRDVDTKIPMGTFTCITGVSDSGQTHLTLTTPYYATAPHPHAPPAIPC